MKKLIFLKNSITTLNGKEYVISQFIDVFNYKVLYGTDLKNSNDLISGSEYECILDVKYDVKTKDYKFKIVSFK